ncbi:MAG: LpxL/LpxP family Kdo(2)-lipid IV(A) lauroyl/palmitoleoyl acyltransferase [Halopseudomonas sp.]
MNNDPVHLKDLLAPKYWLIWVGLGLLRLVMFLPFGVQLSLGRSIGRLLKRLVKKRAHVARANLNHCFPASNESEIEQLVTRHFESLGMALFETAMCWWGSPSRLASLVKDVKGLEHAVAARDQGQGVILLSAHFTTLEISARLLEPHFSFAPVYRRMNNPLLEFFTQKGRNKGGQGAIPKENMKTLVRHLRSGNAIWFASDQQHQGSHSALINFMGQPAHSATGTSDIAKLGKAIVIPFFAHREDDRYVLELGSPMDGVPSGDAVADTERYHRVIEQHIQRSPEQYLWVHKRFKGAVNAPY